MGRAQELLLILEDHWKKHPELGERAPSTKPPRSPRRAMTVYQTYINVLNSDMKAAFEEANPFVFNHVQHPLARGGAWTTSARVSSSRRRRCYSPVCPESCSRCGAATPTNGVIIADFAVQGTLAREILSDCKSITSRNGGRFL